MTFQEVEALTGALPPSAEKYKEWWANHLGNSQANKGWMEVGWRVSRVSGDRREVVFSRLSDASPEALAPEIGVPLDVLETPAAFENRARSVLSEMLGVHLTSQRVTVAPGLVKGFDLVSADRTVIGDAKYYKTLRVPAAKWSTIAEYVWLLQHVDAKRRFMVFGNDRDVPERWLRRFFPLVGDVDFFYLEYGGTVVDLKKELMGRLE
jgi:hypothetical protein